MTMSVKMLDDIAVHAEGLANEARAMADALRAVVDDCAAQLAEKKPVENTTASSGKNSKTASTNSSKEPEWVAEAEKNVVPPEAEPGKKLTIAEVRAYVAGRTTRENRAQIKAILQSFGVAKLTELPEDKYAALMEEVAKL